MKKFISQQYVLRSIAPAALVALIAASTLMAGDASQNLDALTVANIKEFSTALAAALKSARGDEEVAKGIAEAKKLSRKVSDEQLLTVEKYGLSKDGESLRWILGYLLVDRGKFDSAAHLFVEDLVDQKENRQYRMWKWWEYSFGERNEKEYHELNRKIGISLVKQFESGNAEYKLVVAELFGKGEAESKLSVDEFKKAIDFDKKISQ